MRLFLLIGLFAYGYAAVITVCASGCMYTNAQTQTAINAAARGDFIEFAAGEVFEGSFRLPHKGAGSGDVGLRSSRWRELPPLGTRVTSAHAYLMPKFQPPSTVDPAFWNVPEEKVTSSVDLSTDTITISSSHGYTDGEPLNTRFGGGPIPSPLAMGVTYYARDTTSNTFKLAALPGGPVIDLTGSAVVPTFWRWQTQNVGSGYRFEGLEVAKKTGQNTSFTLFQLGRGEEYTRAGIASNFVLDHMYIHGIRDENGPTVCLGLNVRNFTVRDSAITDCIIPSGESKAIAYWQAPGPGLIQNNLLEGASINLLVGGNGLNIYGGMVSGDEGQISIVGNSFAKPMWYKYSAGTSGSGSPVGACSNGAKYLDTSNGQWYQCGIVTPLTWGTGPTCAEGEYYRSTSVTQDCPSGACWSCDGSGVFQAYGALRSSGYLVKNLFECKSCANHFISGNTFNRNWNESQNGIAIQLVSKVDQPGFNDIVNAYDLRFLNNIVTNSGAGLRTATQGGVTFAKTNKRITAFNNLLYKIGATDYPSIDLNTSSALQMSFAGPCESCLYDHNTMQQLTTGGEALQWDTAAFTNPRFSNGVYYGAFYGNIALGNTIPFYWGNGNLINSVGVDYAGTRGAPASMGTYATNGNWITTGTTLFASGSDFRLLPTSPYSASCASGCLYTGTDGKDLGADIDMLESATQGAISGAPWLGGSIQVTPGSTRAIVRYTAPSASACTLKLYTNIGRSTLATDTDSGPEQADDRTGNVTAGLSRQFVLGTSAALTASTRYWGVITCGSSVGYFTLRTLATGAGFNAITRFGGTMTGNYSSSADMSSPTSACSGPTCTVPVPSASVRYFQPAGGAVVAFVSP